MSTRRFPPFLSPVSITSLLLAAIVTLTGLFLLAHVAPFWFMLREPGLRPAFYLLVAFSIVAFAALYVLIAPRMLAFSHRYSPAAHGQKHLPEHLVAACLADIDMACPVCTYNLRGLQGSVCPECNTPVIVYLYGTQRTSTRWTALIICWLAITLVASAITIGAMWEAVSDALSGTYWWSGERLVLFSAVVSVGCFGLLVCAWRAVAMAVPKPPHRQSICARRTAVWLAVVNGACAVAVSVVFGMEILSNWW